jgi:hypothetical protein
MPGRARERVFTLRRALKSCDLHIRAAWSRGEGLNAWRIGSSASANSESKNGESGAGNASNYESKSDARSRNAALPDNNATSRSPNYTPQASDTRQ